jgi:psiF repeat-containing protein
MKLRTMLLVSTTELLLTTGYAVAENAQQDRMKTCNTVATEKGIKGDAREEFMKMCLSVNSGDIGNGKNAQSATMERDGEEAERR